MSPPHWPVHRTLLMVGPEGCPLSSSSLVSDIAVTSDCLDDPSQPPPAPHEEWSGRVIIASAWRLRLGRLSHWCQQEWERLLSSLSLVEWKHFCFWGRVEANYTPSIVKGHAVPKGLTDLTWSAFANPLLYPKYHVTEFSSFATRPTYNKVTMILSHQ